MNLYDQAFVIHLSRRADRHAHASEMLKKCDINANWFLGYDSRDYPPRPGGTSPLWHDNTPNGNAGCTASHRGVLTLAAHGPWQRILVLEDDFLPLYADVSERLAALTWPDGCDLLYLGGHYGEAPIERISPSLIRCATMLTTSSYIVTREHARRMIPYLTGIGPIDNLISMFARDHKHYILQPRLFAQYTSPSDLCGETRDNVPCMTDTRHENMV